MTASPTTSSATIAMKSRRCSRIARLMGVDQVGRADRRAAGPLRSGTAFVWQGTSMRNGRRRRRQHRLDPVGRLDRVAERSTWSLGAPPSGFGVATEHRAAAGLEAQVRAVAVEALRPRRPSWTAP